MGEKHKSQLHSKNMETIPHYRIIGGVLKYFNEGGLLNQKIFAAQKLLSHKNHHTPTTNFEPKHKNPITT